MKYKKIPAKFIRAGTSKGIFIDSSQLPLNKIERDNLIIKLMGSPDPSGLQIDGMGGGITSLSKVALVSKKVIEDKTYLNYLFGQVSVKESKIDWTGNCGNLASGLCEFVKHTNEYEDCVEYNSKNEMNLCNKLRVWQENKKHKMFIWSNHKDKQKMISISGVPGESYPIFVEFNNVLNPDALLFPTGNLIDNLIINEKSINATLMQGVNPIVIIKANSLGLVGNENPKDINYDSIKNSINLIIKKSSEMMNIEVTESLRLALISSPLDSFDNSGNLIKAESVDILSRITAGNRIHHAHTGTGAINISIASNIEGSLAHSVAKKQKQIKEIIIGHPGGKLTCESELVFINNRWEIKRAGFYRTARLLMDGYLYI